MWKSTSAALRRRRRRSTAFSTLYTHHDHHYRRYPNRTTYAGSSKQIVTWTRCQINGGSWVFRSASQHPTLHLSSDVDVIVMNPMRTVSSTAARTKQQPYNDNNTNGQEPVSPSMSEPLLRDKDGDDYKNKSHDEENIQQENTHQNQHDNTTLTEAKVRLSPDQEDGIQTLRRIAEFSTPEHKLIGLSAATLFVTSSSTLILPAVSGKVIDMALLAADGGDPSFSPTLVAAGLFGLISVSGVGVTARTFWLQKAGNNIVERLKQQLFRSILSQDAAYFDYAKSGDLITRLSTDSQLIQGAVTTQAVAVLRGLVMSAGSTVMLFQTSTTLAMVSLATLPPLFLAARLVGQNLRGKQSKVQALHGKATSSAEETIGGIKTVVQFGAERQELERYSKAVTEAHEQAIVTGKTQALFDGAVFIASNGAVLCVLGYGGTMVLAGSISAGELTGFLMYSLLLAGNVSALSGTYAEMMKAVAAADRVFEVMDRQPAIPSSLSPSSDHYDEDSLHREPSQSKNATASDSSVVQCKPLSVDFHKINFSYPTRPDKQILGPEFSLEIQPGEVMALVGGSGSGKSTVAALLTRLYDIDNKGHVAKEGLENLDTGAIFVGGRDIREMDPHDLRQCVGIVSQEPLLFDASIEDNIRYGRRSATHEDVMEAAKVARVLEFTETFPDGLQTMVGARGTQLSGGQKQRVAIARLCVKDPPIVVLDEATSALDAESEYHVKEAIDTVMKGRTVISIAHRLSTIRGADRIAVLQGGQVVEVGTFEELTKKENGAFRSLMGRQLI